MPAASLRDADIQDTARHGAAWSLECDRRV